MDYMEKEKMKLIIIDWNLLIASAVTLSVPLILVLWHFIKRLEMKEWRYIIYSIFAVEIINYVMLVSFPSFIISLSEITYPLLITAQAGLAMLIVSKYIVKGYSNKIIWITIIGVFLMEYIIPMIFPQVGGYLLSVVNP